MLSHLQYINQPKLVMSGACFKFFVESNNALKNDGKRVQLGP